MRYFNLYFLIVMCSIQMYASEHPQQVIRRRRPTTHRMSEETLAVLSQRGLTPESHAIDIKELAYHMADESADCCTAGIATSAFSGCCYWAASEGFQAVPACPELSVISVLGLSGFFCLYKSCEHGKPARELFAHVHEKQKRD